MSGLFRSSVIKGTRITDFSQTTATVGVPIPFGYGRFTSGGNVIWAPLPPKEHRSVQRQGKGGVKQETFTYTLSYAIAFAKGPIFGYWWIKRNGKVVWTQDPAAPVEDRAYAAKWQQRATFYNGTMDQLPDSTIESYEGSGQVSAFHRLAYIVVEDDDVTEGGGAVPTYEACVIASPPDAYMTSRPYPNDMAVEGLRPTTTLSDGTLRQILHTTHFGDSSDVSFGIVSGELREPIVRYQSPVEAVDCSFAMQGGSLKAPIVQYTRWPAETVQTTIHLIGGQLAVKLVKYTYWPSENLAVSLTLQTGYLGA